MGKEILMFGDIEIEKNKFYCYTSYFFNDEDIEKVLICNKISFGDKKVKPLHIMLPKTSTYVKSYDAQLNVCIF